MLKFAKVNEAYKATRKDGQVVIIEKYDGGGWISRYEDDFNGDNTALFKTKAAAVASENRMNRML